MKKQKDLITDFIKRAGYTQKQVADLVGVSDTYFNKALKEVPIPRQTFDKILLAFGVSQDQLLDPDFMPPFRMARKVVEAFEAQEPDAEETRLRAERDRLKSEIETLKAELERRDRIIDALTEK